MSFDEWLNCDRKGGSFSENIKIFIEQKNTDGIISLLSEAYKQGYDNGCFEVLLDPHQNLLQRLNLRNVNND